MWSLKALHTWQTPADLCVHRQAACRLFAGSDNHRQYGAHRTDNPSHQKICGPSREQCHH